MGARDHRLTPRRASGGRRAAVVGIDAFTPFYARSDEEANLRGLRSKRRFSLVEEDLVSSELDRAVREADVVPGGGGVRRTAAGTRLARKALRWTPRTGLREGLEHMMRWARERAAV